jgi:16S rRNA (guanine527-N7)-methyltransferase
MRYRPTMMIEAFQHHGLSISSETASKLKIYEEMLRKWQTAINLVGPSTLDNITEKHFLESAQLMHYIKDQSHILVDMGTGAGFPGLVLAIMGMKNIHLIESDTRKATFLQNVSRETFSPVTIHNCRIEDCEIANVNVVTARALASLKDLLGLMSRFVSNQEAYGLFLKGLRAQDEITEARQYWDFSVEIHDGLSKIVKISDLSIKKSSA